MKLNSRLAGNIIYVIAFAILVYLLAQGFFIPNQHQPIIESLNLSIAIIALVLLGMAYFLRLKSKKSETKKNPSWNTKEYILNMINLQLATLLIFARSTYSV